MTVPQTIALVDLSCIFKKNFHAPNPGVVGGAEKTLAELVAIRESVEHTILCLDSPPYTRRKKIYPEYKATRPPVTDAEKHQKRWLYDELKKGGWQTAKVEGEEADDVIASLARVYELWGAEVRLVGADKDLAQCVTEKVRQLVPAVGERPAELRGPARVFEKFGVKPDQIPLYLALVGDKSDNVPGVPGVGQVKAVALIAEHGDFASLSQALTLRPGQPSGIWKSLADNWTQFEMSLELVVLRRDLGLDALALLDKLEPEAVASMADEGSLELDGLMGNETPMPESASLAAQIAAEHAKLNVLMSAEPAKSERPQPIIGKDPKADQVLRDLAAQRHEREQEREEEWRKQMREENEAAERLADNRAAANDQKPASGPRAVPDAEFDPIGKSPGASGPLPPKPETKQEAKALAKTQAQADNYGLVGADLQPQDLRACSVISKWLHASQLYPQFRSEQAIFAVIMRGKELGLGVTTALAGFHVVEGKPTASADLIRSLATRSPKCKYFRLVHSDESYAEWETWHVDHPEPTKYRYTIEEASKAGLRGGNWEKRKRDMLTKTAAVKLARICYAGDVLGLYAPEEFNDVYGEAAA
jgi:5'-3' exonuclease